MVERVGKLVKFLAGGGDPIPAGRHADARAGRAFTRLAHQATKAIGDRAALTWVDQTASSKGNSSARFWRHAVSEHLVEGPRSPSSGQPVAELGARRDEGSLRNARSVVRILLVGSVETHS
ncbi:MAG: hypothetical protein M3025_08190 [Actinomycetota bacterium]|nr:hypothetical protein [Actinomycetota bacterium]